MSAFVYLVLFCPVLISLLLPHDLYASKVPMKVGLKIYRLAFKHCLEIHGKTVYSLVPDAISWIKIRESPLKSFKLNSSPLPLPSLVFTF